MITPDGATDIPELYREGRRLLDSGDAAGAAKYFERIVAVEPDGELAPDALYLGAQAREQAGDREAALRMFEQLARRFPNHALGREAMIRAMRLLVFMERWQRAEALADQVLSKKRDLSPPPRDRCLEQQSLGSAGPARCRRGQFQRRESAQRD